LGAVWPFVVENLPSPPARVVEIGCGSKGGFVPALLDIGFDAVGIDPDAPVGPAYRQTKFERYALDQPVDGIVACTSLHHVDDLDAALGLAASVLTPRGRLVVVEWAWELFDEPTAEWCFARLPPPDGPAHHGWLREHRDRWAGSGGSWQDYVGSWTTTEGMHAGHEVVASLETHFLTRVSTVGPSLFSDLREDVTEADELSAIAAGQIRATGIRYVGVPRRLP
jgi:SAM-dependent methyltransferase